MFPYFSHFPDDFPRIKSRMRSVGQDMSLSASHPGTEDREPRHPQEIKKWICKSLAGYGKITRNPGQATEASTPHPGSRLQVLHCPCSLPHWGACEAGHASPVLWLIKSAWGSGRGEFQTVEGKWSGSAVKCAGLYRDSGNLYKETSRKITFAPAWTLGLEMLPTLVWWPRQSPHWCRRIMRWRPA